MLTAIEIIELRVPDWFNEISLSRWNFLVEYASEQTGKEFGTCRENAIALKVLHIIAKNKVNSGDGNTNSGTGTSGSISSITEGGLSIAYSTAKSTNDDLSTTQYGCELIELINGCIMGYRNRLV